MKVLIVIPGQENAASFAFSKAQARELSVMDEIEVVTLYWMPSFNPLQVLGFRKNLRETIRKNNIQLVHVHYGTLVGACALFFSGNVKRVITFHGSDLNVTKNSDGFLRDIFGRLLSNVANLLANQSIVVADQMKKGLWFKRDKAKVLPMVPDLSLFSPSSKSESRKKLLWDSEQKIILFNGNNPSIKRLDLALTVEKLLQEAGFHLRLQVLKGKTNPAEIPLLLSASDAVLLCSNSEGSPAIIKEAMACNIPVISTDVGDAKQVLQGVVPGGIYLQNEEDILQGFKELFSSGVEYSNGREILSEKGLHATYVNEKLKEIYTNLILE